MQVQSLGQEDPLEKGMTIHSSIPAWRITHTCKEQRNQDISSKLYLSRWIPPCIISWIVPDLICSK